MIKVIKIRKLNKTEKGKTNKKKYEITFNKNGKEYKRKFGALGMSDFTIHKDKNRREQYITRHKKDLSTNDPMRPGYLSMYILWNKSTFKASVADYKKRLNIYNKTGKFPKKISGSKKLSFGTIIPKGTTLDMLPDDALDLIQRKVSKYDIQTNLPRMYKKYRKSPLYLENLYNKRSFIIGTKDTTKFFNDAVNILTKRKLEEDSDFWVAVIKDFVEQFMDLDPDRVYQRNVIKQELEIQEGDIVILLERLGHYEDFDEPGWYNRAYAWIDENFGDYSYS